MLSFFRRIAARPLGIAIFGLVLLAFMITLYEGKTGMSLPGTTGGALAKVGGVDIGEGETVRRVQVQLEAARQQTPGLDMAAFVAQGGADQTIDQLINGRALERFAADQGIVASRRLVDGAIASIPAFNGPDGKFDRETYLNVLRQRKIPEAQLREDFAREAVTKALLIPVAGAARMPDTLVAPYAALLLETRQGEIGLVPASVFASAEAISDADIATFYHRQIARYTVPERRIIRFAEFDRSRFADKVAPGDTEIAAAFRADTARYAARDTRSFTQIIVRQKQDADALAAKIRGGMTMDAAAKSVGLEALPVAATDKDAFARLTSGAVADAAFTASRGSIATVVQSGLGFHIVRVESITLIPARSLADARGEILATLSKRKIDDALADLVNRIEDAISGGATFDDVSKQYALNAATTPPVTASGLAPDAPGYTLPPELVPLLRDAFQAETSDDASVTAVGDGTRYAVYHMDRIVPAAARPLAQIRPQVVADAQNDRALKAAKRTADAIAAAVNRGTSFAQAFTGAGVKLPAPSPAGGRRVDIARDRDRVPPPLALLFTMAEKRAKVLATPKGIGWFVVYLDRIVPGDQKSAQPLIAATQQQLTRVVGDEYVAQFAAAVKARVGVTRNAGAIAAFKRGLTGGAARR